MSLLSEILRLLSTALSQQWEGLSKPMRRVAFGSLTALTAWIAATAHVDALGNFTIPPVAKHWLSEQVRTVLEQLRAYSGLSPTAFYTLIAYSSCAFWLGATLLFWRLEKKSGRKDERTKSFIKLAKVISILLLGTSVLNLFGI